MHVIHVKFSTSPTFAIKIVKLAVFMCVAKIISIKLAVFMCVAKINSHYYQLGFAIRLTMQCAHLQLAATVCRSEYGLRDNSGLDGVG